MPIALHVKSIITQIAFCDYGIFIKKLYFFVEMDRKIW